MANSEKPSIKQRILNEIKKFSGIVGYVWVVLVLLDLHKLAIFRELNHTYRVDYRIGLAFVSAVVLGKVVLVADELHVAEQLRGKQLILSVLFRSAVFALLLLFFDVLEQTIVGMVHGKTFVQSIPRLGGGGLEGNLIAGIIMFVFFIPYFSFVEVLQVVGKDRLRSLIFAKKSGA